jgi:hypothetical protein
MVASMEQASVTFVIKKGRTNNYERSGLGTVVPENGGSQN